MSRLRKKPWAEKFLQNSKITFIDPNKINWKKIFGNSNDLWIDIGMGKGKFTITQSKINSNINILGIEKFPSVQVVPIKISEIDNLKNIKFISGDVSDIKKWFKNDSIDKIFINFPDPWPKLKHLKKRLLFRTFLNDYYDILKNKSYIEFKTDQINLFEFAIKEIKYTNFKVKNENRDLHFNNIHNVLTEYETKFSEKGNKIFYVEFHK